MSVNDSDCKSLENKTYLFFQILVGNWIHIRLLQNVVYGGKMIYEMGDACSRKLYYSGELNDSRKLRAASKLSSSLTSLLCICWNELQNLSASTLPTFCSAANFSFIQNSPCRSGGWSFDFSPSSFHASCHSLTSLLDCLNVDCLVKSDSAWKSGDRTTGNNWRRRRNSNSSMIVLGSMRRRNELLIPYAQENPVRTQSLFKNQISLKLP